MMRKRNTDVPASIAGYYYQFILACRELVRLLVGPNDDNDGVGVERGADIRIFSNSATNIEAKFYADKHFTKNHSSIRHTIFNFYRNYIENLGTAQLPSKYMYVTNVPIHVDDMDFFNQWPRNGTTHDSNYVAYIRNSVIRESLVAHPPAKEAFANYKSTLPTGMKENWYVEHLISTLEQKQDESEYKKYGYESSHQEIEQFLSMVHFDFSRKNMEKVDTIRSIIIDIEQMLVSYKSTLTPEDCRQIVMYLVQALFDTTIDKTVTYITKAKLKEIIHKQESRLLEFHENRKHQEIINAIDEEIDMLKDALEQDYNGENSDEIIRAFLLLVEKLYEELETSGLTPDEFIQNYTLTHYGNTAKHITSMLRPMAILSVYLNLNPNDVAIKRLSGIHNFQFAEWESLCLKNGSSSLTMNMVIRKFVQHTIDQAAFIDDTNIIVLESPYRTCQLKKDALQGIVMNITNVEMNEKLYELYSSLNYKCTHCLRIQDNDCQIREGVEQFVRGVCK